MKQLNGSVRIAIPTTDGIEIHPCHHILRCEANRDSSYIYLSNGKHIQSVKSLKYYEELLSSCNFFRVHKTHIINLRHIKKYVKGKGGTLVLTDNSNIDVAIRKKNDLIKTLNSFFLSSEGNRANEVSKLQAS